MPAALARVLAADGHAAEHVADVALERATDSVVWDYAVAHSAVIITKDQDFAERRGRSTAGPCIVWVRVGNTSRQAMLRWFVPLLPEILDHIAAGEPVVEIR